MYLTPSKGGCRGIAHEVLSKRVLHTTSSYRGVAGGLCGGYAQCILEGGWMGLHKPLLKRVAGYCGQHPPTGYCRGVAHGTSSKRELIWELLCATPLKGGCRGCAKPLLKSAMKRCCLWEQRIWILVDQSEYS